MDKRLFAILAVFTVQVLYGLNFTFAKVLMNDHSVPPFALVILRVVGATILFWAVSVFLPQEKIEKKDFLKFFVAAIFGVVINMLLFLKGLELTTPINASVIITTTPIIILILSSFFLNEKITKLKIVGVLLGFSGGILLTLLGTSDRVGDNLPLGNLLIFINVIAYSIYIILIKKLTNKYHPFTFIKWLFLFGSIMVIPFGYSDLISIEWTDFTSDAWFAVVFVVVGATFGTYLLNPLALRQLKASTIGIFIYLQPVIAGIFAIIMGADTIEFVKIAAMLLIFAGVFLVSKRPKANLN
ncbi:DMT family transporter [Subsaxibacter sp. CAU 1640]|uniref:DMT family transporter n=1 Tax=Subsaxibacter sp. CAU 1640 TaxID=2933271 RepID=UPI0020057922|nr:DMT family transporter [Subsaxibacter sp. CAU 1640]MCK7589687.1 DMT family transporter [Subsaxibacter sp. CAU 1640]